MGEMQYVPGSTEAVALAIEATWEPGQGWRMAISTAHPSEHGIRTKRMSYRGLTSTELNDVIDVELAQALGVI